MLGYGVALALIFEIFRRRKDPFRDPTSDWILEFFREELFPADERLLSREKRYERFLKRQLRVERDLFGSDCHFRAATIESFVDLAWSQHRFSEAIAWHDLAIRLFEHNLPKNEKRVIVAHRKMSSMKRHTSDFTGAEAHLRKSIEWADSPSLEDKKQLLSILTAQSRWQEAGQLSTEILYALEKEHGYGTQPVEDWLVEEVKLYRLMSDEATAESKNEHLTLVRSVNLLVTALGGDSPSSARDFEALSQFFSRHGRYEAHLAMKREAELRRLIAAVKGPDYPGIESDLRRVAEWYRARAQGGDLTVAFRMEKRADLIREKARNSTH